MISTNTVTFIHDFNEYTHFYSLFQCIYSFLFIVLPLIQLKSNPHSFLVPRDRRLDDLRFWKHKLIVSLATKNETLPF